jgi:hypothetical protein
LRFDATIFVATRRGSRVDDQNVEDNWTTSKAMTDVIGDNRSGAT